MQREQNRQQQKIRGKNNTKSRQHVWEMDRKILTDEFGSL